MLPNNNEGSLCRLKSLNKRLERQNLASEYAEIIELICEPRQNRRIFELCMTLLQEPLMALHLSMIV